MIRQQQFLAWPHTDNFTKEDRRWFVDRDNPDCPLSRYIGNDRAVKRLARAAFVAWGNRNHICDQNFALVGPASTGKTTLAKLFAETIMLPFVEIHPKSIDCVNDILAKIAEVCQNIGDGNKTMELVPQKHDGKDMRFLLPPMVVFIDEVHALKETIVHGLLKATERNDSKLVTEVNFSADCSNVCWIIATTERGKLFDAFDTRFTKIDLKLYSAEEIAQIVQLNNPDWDLDVCRLVAKYAGRVPREALAFAKEMRDEHEMYEDEWSDVARVVAEDNGIDEFGMTYRRLDILKALGQGPIATARLADVAGCKKEELEKFIMPALLAAPALVKTSSRGYSITEAGLEELDKRGIDHNGVNAVVGRVPNKLLDRCLLDPSAN